MNMKVDAIFANITAEIIQLDMLVGDARGIDVHKRNDIAKLNEINRRIQEQAKRVNALCRDLNEYTDFEHKDYNFKLTDDCYNPTRIK